jgi:predicted metal-binding membrane protein
MRLGLRHGIADGLQLELEQIADADAGCVGGEVHVESGRRRLGEVIGLVEEAPRTSDVAAQQATQGAALRRLGSVVEVAGRAAATFVDGAGPFREQGGVQSAQIDPSSDPPSISQIQPPSQNPRLGRALKLHGQPQSQLHAMNTWPLTRQAAIPPPQLKNPDRVAARPVSQVELQSGSSMLLLAQKRFVVVALIAAASLVCWAWIVAMARDMYGPMTGPSAWMMTARWDAVHVVLLWAMWAVMMIAMMLPSALPLIVLAGSIRNSLLLALGYAVVWAVFSVGATALQRVLARLLLMNPMMEASSPAVAAALLALAGVYQLTPLKHACLRTCQSPMAFVARRWRSGAWGAFWMGIEHGMYCVGCCWALMLLLFAGGVMSLTVILALTVFVAFEKLVHLGPHAARVSGLMLLATAAWLLLR